MRERIDRALGRYFLKDDVRDRVAFEATQQSQGVSAPGIEKPVASGATVLELPPVGRWPSVSSTSLEQAIMCRRSRRVFSLDPLVLEELSFLLWATQGVEGVTGKLSPRRTVPSAGNRHAFETYLIVSRVNGLEPGLYRYLPLTHQLASLRAAAPLPNQVTDAARGQRFVEEAAVVFCWTVLPIRMEWRYEEASYKVLALDAGHVCQNLYLACECIGAGTCAIAAYDQTKVDALIGVDGTEEFTIYLAPVGKRVKSSGRSTPPE